MKRRTRVNSSACIGALFKNRSSDNPKAPVLCGYVDLSDEFIEELISAYDEEDQVRIELSAWMNKAQATGSNYLTMKLAVPRSGNRSRNESSASIPSLLSSIDEE